MMILRAFFTGLRVAFTAPKLLFFLWCALLLAAAPFGLLMQQEIERDIGGSRIHVELRERMDLLWLGEFHDRSPGLGKMLAPVTLARADFLRNLDLLFSGELFTQHRGLVAAGVGYALVWVLLLGGVVDRFARGPGRLVLSQFLAAAGRYFPRLLRLSALSAGVYWLLYLGARRAFEALDLRLLDVTSESEIFAYYLSVTLPVLLAVGVIMSIFDYARIASVLEEEPNTLKALRRGVAFFGRNPLACLALALLVALAVAGVVAARTAFAPGVGEVTGLGVLAVFAVGQAFLLARLALRLTLVGAELTFYRARRR